MPLRLSIRVGHDCKARAPPGGRPQAERFADRPKRAEKEVRGVAGGRRGAVEIAVTPQMAGRGRPDLGWTYRQAELAAEVGEKGAVEVEQGVARVEQHRADLAGRCRRAQG